MRGRGCKRLVTDNDPVLRTRQGTDKEIQWGYFVASYSVARLVIGAASPRLPLFIQRLPADFMPGQSVVVLHLGGFRRFLSKEVTFCLQI